MTTNMNTQVMQQALDALELSKISRAAPYQVTDEQAEAVMTRLGLSDCRTAVKIALQHHEARKATA